MPAPGAEKALRKAIRARGPFERAYYLHGADDYLKEHALRDLIASAVDPATRDFNLDIRAAPDLDAETLGSLLGTPPMMADRRVVVLRDVHEMKKEARGTLERYLAQPAPDVVLVMVAPAGETKGNDALRTRSFPVEFAPLDDDRLPKWISHHAREEHDATITPGACVMLQSAVGNDLPSLAAEIDKLASYASGKTIDEDAVAAVVGVRRGETLADLLDCVARRDAVRALAILPHVMAQPKTGGVPVVMALTALMLALGYGAALRTERGTSGRALESEYWNFLKSGGSVMTGRPWGEAVRAWMRDVERWDVRAVDRALAVLYAADIGLKDTRVSSEDRVIATTILAICSPD
jgi:DNA polymerase-3 subunit delta